MTLMSFSYNTEAYSLGLHREWIGYLQPQGLVVSPPALLRAQAIVERGNPERQQSFREFVGTSTEGSPCIKDFVSFVRGFLEWSDDEDNLDFVALDKEGEETLRDRLTLSLVEFQDTLAPDWVFFDEFPEDWEDGQPDPLLMLIKEWPSSQPFDQKVSQAEGWDAAPHERMERLLRESGVEIGLLTNGCAFRLLYAPRGESAGHMDFPVEAMLETSGRLILNAFQMLLSFHRLKGESSSEKRLHALLQQSRKYQNEVSETLSQQVFDAFLALLRGFQQADQQVKETLLQDWLKDKEGTDEIYSGLLTVLLRLILLLYAEGRGLMPNSPLYKEHYGLVALYEQLQEDADLHPDSMDLRFGAWARLLTLFRLVYQGQELDRELTQEESQFFFSLPPRSGELFDPRRFPFLEGRARGDEGQLPSLLEEVPRISDGVVHRMLHSLLYVKGERLDFSSLEVEHLGSIYENMMGFFVQTCEGTSVGLRPNHVVINLDELLSVAPKNRVKWLKEQADCKLSAKFEKLMKAATCPRVSWNRLVAGLVSSSSRWSHSAGAQLPSSPA